MDLFPGSGLNFFMQLMDWNWLNNQLVIYHTYFHFANISGLIIRIRALKSVNVCQARKFRHEIAGKVT